MTKKNKKTVRDYDYTKFDHVDDCKLEHVICPVCLEKENKIRMGHKVDHILIPIHETIDDIEIKHMISHCHFALLKGTQTPAVAEARNIHCEVSREMVNKKERTYRSYRLKKKKEK